VGPADAVTIANGVFGFAAIGVLLRGSSSGAAWGSGLGRGHMGVVLALLTASCVCDALDGPVARRFGSSGLGCHLDLMCDTVSFGVAPALLLLHSPAAYGGARAVIGPIVAGVYVAAMMVRLASFAEGEHSERGFVGLPSPAAGIIVVGLLAVRPEADWMLVAVPVIAALMVSEHVVPRPQGLGLVAFIVFACGTSALLIAGVLPARLFAVIEVGGVLLSAPLEASIDHLVLLATTRHAHRTVSRDLRAA
jgi:CDP-diacylglycerol--serine O-phosphatidyltransferase